MNIDTTTPSAADLSDDLPPFAETTLDLAACHPEPAVRSFTNDDGTEVVAVSLTGSFGAGKEMLLNADTWKRVSRRHGARWLLVPQDANGAGPYVATGRVGPAREMGSTARSPVTYLSRLIAKPAKTHVVTYANGDTLNLTDRNLIVLSSRDFQATRFLPVEMRRALLLEARKAA